VEREYTPRAEYARIYAGLYERYASLARFVEDETMASRRTEVNGYRELKEIAWRCNMELPKLGLALHTFATPAR